MEVTPFECTECCKYYKSDKILKNHIFKIHTNNEFLKCHICNKKYSTKYILDEHVKLHETKQFTCTRCNIHFAVSRNLTTHIITHYNIGGTGNTGGTEEISNDPYKCNICGKQCVTRSGFVGHITTHTGKKFRCKPCNLVYKYQCGLKKHMNMKHN